MCMNRKMATDQQYGKKKARPSGQFISENVARKA